MSKKLAPCFAIVAGEASGDILGQNLIQALKAHYPDARFIGVGGEKMTAAGLESLGPIETLSVMGLWEPLKKLPQILKLRQKILKTVSKQRPACYIGIDAPDFNLGIEKNLKRKGIATVHLVSPTIWAWRAGRIHGIKKAVDLMLLIYPFEKAIYDQHQIKSCYIGHPLADQIHIENDKSSARDSLNLSKNEIWIGLMPGSREAEIRYLANSFVATAKWIHGKLPTARFLMPCVNEKRKQQALAIFKQAGFEQVTCIVNQSTLAMQACDVILLASGTAALQAALIKRPFIVAYKMSWITYQIAKRIIKVSYISMPNIIKNRPIIKEFIQQDASAEKMGQALLTMIEQPQTTQPMLESFTEIHMQLKQDAGKKAGQAIADFVGV